MMILCIPPRSMSAVILLYLLSEVIHNSIYSTIKFSQLFINKNFIVTALFACRNTNKCYKFEHHLKLHDQYI